MTSEQRAGGSEQAVDGGPLAARHPLPAKDLRFIAFRVGPETFIVDIMAVRQIVAYSGSTHVPTAPRFIEGVIVLRNEVIPVIDLRARLYPDGRESAEQALVLITHSPAGAIGLKVDEVRRIVTLSSDDLLPAPAVVRGVLGEFLVAIAPYGEELFLVLDIERVLSVNEQHELRQSDLTPNA